MSSRPGPLAQRIAAEIRAELGRQNRSRRWLAEQIGQNHVTVSRWVNGESPLSFDALDSICETLGITIADLLAATDRHGESLPPAARSPRNGSAPAESGPAGEAEGNESTDDTGQYMRTSPFGFSRNVTVEVPLVTHAA